MSWLDKLSLDNPSEPKQGFGGSDVGAGLERSGLGLSSALHGAAASAFNSEEEAQRAAYQERRQEEVPVRFRSYRDVDPLSSDVFGYMRQTGAEQAPVLGMMALGGVPGAVARSAMGARIGGGLASGAMQYGEMSNELRREGLEPTPVTAGAALLGGALDVIGLESLTKGMLKSAVGEQIKNEVKASAATRALRGGFGGFLEGVKNELPAELTQEVLAVGNRAYSDPSYLNKTGEIADRFAETAVATTAFAGPLGAAPGAIGGLHSTPGSTPEVTPYVQEPNAPVPPDNSTATVPPSSVDARTVLPQGESVPPTTEATPPKDTSVLDQIKQAPSHDMSLDELRALDSSTSPGDTNGESQNATQESTLPPNETGQRQEVLEPAGAKAPAPVSSGRQLTAVNTSLPEEARALLDTIAGTESPGYNTRYGGKTFEGFDDHPRIGQRIERGPNAGKVSKAAGRYQFITGTWDAQAKKLGLKDFSPENQDLAAWDLAEEVYKSKTNRDLLTDLKSTDPEVHANVGKVLADTWTSLPGGIEATTHGSRFSKEFHQNLQRERGAPTTAAPQKQTYTPEQNASEVTEVARRKVAGEPIYQDTALGRAIKGQTETDNEQTGQTYADEGLQFEDTDDGFSLTFKGRKRESTGEDLMRPSRPLPEAEDDTFEGMTPESTPVRAFSEALYPGAKIEISGKDTPNLQRIVSVQFPEEQRQALGEDQKYIARASLEALVSGTKVDPKDKILLEHPNVISSKSDKPIEIPVTKDGLAKLGRALDPGAYDSAPSASHAAAVSGLTHLIYEKGFVPRGVDVSKVKEVRKWIGEKLGKAPTSNQQDKASDRPTSSVDPELPITRLVSFAKATTAPTVAKNLSIPHVTLEKDRTPKSERPNGTIVFGGAETKVTREVTKVKGKDGKEVELVRPRLIIGRNDMADVRGMGEQIRSFLQENKVSRPLVQGDSEQATRILNYALSPDVKSVAPASRSTPIAFANTDTDVGGQLANLTAPVEARPGSQRFTPVESRPGAPGYKLDAERHGAIGQTPVEFSQQYDKTVPASIPVRAGQSADLGFSGQGFDEGAYVAPLTEMAEGTDPAAEDEPYVAANRLDRVVNQTITKEFDASSIGAMKERTRRGIENTVNRVQDTAKRTRELDSKSIETVHKVSGGATVRATGVSDKVVRFFTEALKDIGLEVPLRVMGRAGITQHLDALQQRLDGLVEAIQREEETLSRMPNMLKEEKKARKEQEKKVLTLRRALQDASREQELLLQAQEDQFAARVIYNDHYQDATRRTPVIIVSDEAAASKHLTKVLGHELGHVVQRAWFDQLPSDLKKDILQELSENGAYTDDIAEAFADKFLSWYERNKRGEKIKGKQEGIRANKMEGVLQRLVNVLQRLWNNLVGHDKAFAKEYPKFDEFLRSTVGVYGRMKPINPTINKLWTESLAQPYGGLPLAVADREQFNDMSPEEYRAKVAEGIQTAKDRAAQYAKNKAGENVVRQRYLRKANETYDAFKKMAAVALEADGTWLRNAGSGILKGYANIVAPIKGRVMSNMQVIKPVLVQAARSNTPALYAETRDMNGSIQTLNDLEYGKWRRRLDPILNRISQLSPEEYKSLVDDLRDETTPSKTKLADDIRSYFAAMLRFMRAHEVRLGARSGYYTKSWDITKLQDDEAAAIAAFEKVFAAREELPVNPNVKVPLGQEPVRFSTPRAAALYEYRRITTGRIDNVFEQLDEESDPELRGPALPYSRHRMFSNEEYDKFGLNKWLNDDIGWVMNTYTQLGVKRAVQQMATGIPKSQRTNMTLRKYWEGRFTKAKLRPEVMHSPVASLELLLAEGIQDGRLSEEDYLEARKRILSVMGQTNVGSDPRMRRWTSRILAYETLRTLTWGAFAQLADFGISAWRADSMNRVGKVMGQMLDKQTVDQQKELLRTVGLSLDELTRHALNSGMMSMDPMQKGTQWLTEKFFTLNGMHKLSEMNLLFSSMLGQSYLKEYADQALNGATEKERDIAMKRIRELHPSITPAEILTGGFSTDSALQIALHEYVSQSHLHNQIGYTPRLFNDYRFAIFTQLKGFMFKYHNIVLRQVWERMKDQPDLLHAAIPVVTLAAATMPLALLGMWLKDRVRRDVIPGVAHMAGVHIFDLKKQKERTPTDWFHDAVMASGMPGVYIGMFDNMLEAPQHGQPGIVALAGPTVGQVFNISARTADEWLPDAIPLVATTPGFRSALRSGLRNTFGFGVRDEEE